MRNPVLFIAMAIVLSTPCAALAGDKKTNKGIEIQDYGFGVSKPVTISRSDGGGATIGKRNTGSGTLSGSIGPTKPTLPTTGGQHK